MQEKDQKVVQMPAGTELRRKPPVPNVPQMRRSKTPARPNAPIWEGKITPEANLTEEQKAPLSNRPKPVNEAQENFPKPVKSGPIEKPSAPMKRNYIEKGAKTVSMKRHVPSVLEHPPIKTKPTKIENVAPTPEDRPEKSTGAVSAAVVKMPIDKKPLILSAIALFLVLVLVVGIVLGVMYGSDLSEMWKPSFPGFSSEDPPDVVENKQVVLTDRPFTAETNFFAPADPNDPDAKNSFSYDYAVSTLVGFDGNVVRTLDKNEIVKPIAETQNEGSAFSSEACPNGNTAYPKFGSTLKAVIGGTEDKTAARSALVSESAYLCAWGTAGANRGGAQTPDKYTRIDANGYLYQYKDNEWIHSLEWGKTADEYTEENFRQLYKHNFANGLYLGDVSDNQPRVEKQVTLRPRGYSSYSVTGIYAPAGEVIKVELSEKDMNATGGITIHIGQALYNGQANNIWVSKNQMNRVPHLLTTLVLNKSTCTYDEENHKYVGYVGSFLGGPLYIRNTSAKFTATITGGVEYVHFILGHTTKAEYERILKAQYVAPYFDLEVWDRGVLHSGPLNYAKKFSYEDLYKAAVLWDKVASVTAYSSNQGIVFLYDSFVAAGAAVAFPGRSSVNCPLGWMEQSLNYNTLVTSGSWGNFHEYHHNFQNYGLGSGADGEVTNNGLNLVSYALFTKISSKRGIGSYGAQGLGGWNNYTSGSWTLQRVINGQITSTNGLAIYATLLHNFGAYAYTYSRGASGKNNYLNKWANVTHHDFTYFAGLIDSINNYGGGTYTASDAVKNANYPMFVPVASVYQTGRSYLYDGEKKYFTTMQPYVIPAGDEFTIDLSPYTAPSEQYASGSVVIPKGFQYRIKSISQPANGKIETIDDYHFKYVPDPDNKSLRSGQIVATLEIVKDDGAFEVEETDLILEFEQSHEKNKMTLERTTYTYTDATMYKDAVAAFDAGFAGSASFVKQDQFNPTQNVNTDIWFRPDNDKTHASYPNDPDKYFIHENQIEVIDGKLYFDDDGTYRVYLRGRSNCALYYSPDGKNYTLGAKINENTPAAPSNKTYLFRPNAPETYFDVKFEEGKVYVKSGSAESFPSSPIYTIQPNSNKEIVNWLYIKEVLIDTTTPAGVVSYIGVGMRAWTQTMFTMTETYHNASDKAVDSPTADGYAYTKITYRDYNNNEVAYSKTVVDGTTTYFKKSGSSWVASTEKEVSELTESRMIAPTVTENSQPYINAYRNNYQFPDNSGFESEYFYARNYNYSYTDNKLLNGSQTLLQSQCKYSSPPTSWGWGSFPIANIADGNKNTFIHTRAAVSESSPLVLTLDMGEVKSVNRMTIYSQNRPNGDWKVAKNFTLEGSIDGEEYFEVGNFVNIPRNGANVTVDFEETAFRYYRLTVTKSYDNHIIIGEIEMWHAYEILGNGANHFSPDHESLIYVGEWEYVPMMASYGYTYHGKNGSKIKFEMKGTQFMILTSQLEGIDPKNFDVYIDGKRYDSVPTKKDDGDYAVNYISPKLESGSHKVEIRLKGDVYFDSIALFNN